MPDITIVDYIKPNAEITNTCVIITFNGLPAIHLKDLINSNPSAEIFIVEDSRDMDNVYKWKSCDTPIRSTWKVIKDKALSNNITFLERDVLVTARIPVKDYNTCILSSIGGPPKPYDVSWEKENWWWPEGDRLPLHLKKKTIGAGITMAHFTSDILDKLIAEEFDEIFDIDIISEIRLPTIINYLGSNITAWKDEGFFVRLHCAPICGDGEKDVLDRIKNKIPGLYHPVKHEII